MELTNDKLRELALAIRDNPDRIQGFSYGENFGPPHIVRDVYLEPGAQELWRGDDQEEMLIRCRMERLRLALDTI